MSNSYKIESNDVGVGVYDARFVILEDSPPHPEYGAGKRFEWCVTSPGKFKGKSAYRTTGVKPSPKNAFGKMLAALAGVSPSDGMEINADDYIGRMYVIVVEETDNGSTRVGSAMLKEDSPQS